MRAICTPQNSIFELFAAHDIGRELLTDVRVAR